MQSVLALHYIIALFVEFYTSAILRILVSLCRKILDFLIYAYSTNF